MTYFILNEMGSHYCKCNDVLLFQGTTEGHVCPSCYIQLERSMRVHLKLVKTPLKSTKKRKITPTVSSHIHRKKVILSPYPSTTRTTVNNRYQHQNIPKDTLKAINRSHYYTAFRHILSTGIAAKKAFRKILQNTIAQEIQQYLEKNNYPLLHNVSSIETFNWESTLNDAARYMPTLLDALHAALPTKLKTEKRYMIISEIFGIYNSI